MLLALNQRHHQSAHYSQALGSLTKDQAHDLVFRLNDEERGILYQTLQNFQIKQEKQSLECEYKARKVLEGWRDGMSVFINQPETPKKSTIIVAKQRSISWSKLVFFVKF